MAESSANSGLAGEAKALASLLPRLTRPVFRKRGPAGAQIMADWPALVGHALAAATAPRSLVQGTLTIACAGPVALELSHLAPQLVATINRNLGRNAILRLRFVQAAAPAPALAPPPGAVPRPRRPVPGAVRAAVSGVASEPLRTALEKLAVAVYRSRD